MNRDNLNPGVAEAMRLLDMVRAGVYVPIDRVNWALAVTGDLALAEVETA